MSQRFDRESGYPVASFKALDGKRRGEFEALVSVFGNVDLIGERVVKGAFAKSLGRWRESGDPIPVIWNHQWDNPLAHIGKVDEAEETDDGLLVKGSIDLDNGFAAQVYRLMSERRVKELSFGYKIQDSEKAKDGALDLLELDLIEVGPTLKGMNPETELVAVKAFRAAEFAEVKAGARLSKETRAALQNAIELMASLLSADDPEKSEAEETKSDEAEASGKASELDLDLITRIQFLKEN